jgi:hypothetical protein
MGYHLLMYLFFTAILVPLLAPVFGRVSLPVFTSANAPVKPVSLFTCLMNRHYVQEELGRILEEISLDLGKEVQIVYLDANFPFINGFPLLPHKSHDDGKKVDIAFIYTSLEGDILNKGKGFLGYGVIEYPKSNEFDQAAACHSKGYWQYSLLEKVAFQRSSPKYTFSNAHNRQLIRLLTTDNRVGKIFIEPHLKQRLGLGKYDKIRFHGCAAVRHDDHIHIQL